jgi:hypothetical protein
MKEEKRETKEGTSVLTTAAQKCRMLNLQMLNTKEKSLRRFNKGRYGCMDGIC